MRVAYESAETQIFSFPFLLAGPDSCPSLLFTRATTVLCEICIRRVGGASTPPATLRVAVAQVQPPFLPSLWWPRQNSPFRVAGRTHSFRLLVGCSSSIHVYARNSRFYLHNDVVTVDGLFWILVV